MTIKAQVVNGFIFEEDKRNHIISELQSYIPLNNLTPHAICFTFGNPAPSPAEARAMLSNLWKRVATELAARPLAPIADWSPIGHVVIVLGHIRAGAEVSARIHVQGIIYNFPALNNDQLAALWPAGWRQIEKIPATAADQFEKADYFIQQISAYRQSKITPRA